MSEQSIVSIVLTLITVLGGGGGVVAFFRYRNEAPIKQRDADIAVAKTSQEMALASAQAHYESSTFYQSQVKDLQSNLNEESERRENLRETLERRMTRMEEHIREQDQTVTKLTMAVRAFSRAWDDLIENWAMLRERDHPPAKPKYDV